MAHTPSSPPRSIFGLLRPYRFQIGLLLLLTLCSSSLGLVLPKLIQWAIDSYTQTQQLPTDLVWRFGGLAAVIVLLSYGQAVVQTLSAERVARDLRRQLAGHLSEQSYASVQTQTPAKLLTHLTSDVDAIKLFVSQALASLVSSLLLIGGASVLLLQIHWPLALAVLSVLPLIGLSFFFVLRRVRVLFRTSQEVIDRLNRLINENIWGAALVRVLDAQKTELGKFTVVNTAARENGMRILQSFAGLIPAITFLASLGSLIILLLGGHYVMVGSLSLGELTAFNAYLALLIFPIVIIGFTSSLVARASASYGRISHLLEAPPPPPENRLSTPLQGEVSVADLSLNLGQRPVLHNISLQLTPGSRTAIVGPTAAGKTTLLYLLAGLLAPDSGSVSYDGKPLEAYDPQLLHSQVGLVFQDSALFNLSLRENIAFNPDVDDASLAKALETAELTGFVAGLPAGLDTLVSERGLSLSGGQKQRLILARALALNPRVLLLDDFTARVDARTEAQILANLRQNYPDLTLLSVTQKIAALDDYEQILLLMEGEILARGTHAELLASSPEYMQIAQSQRSTSQYEHA
ncbi:MAG: ABC transporter ATP-binding protein [Candidatus Sericytochromatia bacterium]